MQPRPANSPHAEGNAAATYVFLPCGEVMPSTHMCSANLWGGGGVWVCRMSKSE